MSSSGKNDAGGSVVSYGWVYDVFGNRKNETVAAFADPFGLECMKLPVTRTIVENTNTGINITVEAASVLVCFPDPPNVRGVSVPIDESDVLRTIRLMDPPGVDVMRRRPDQDARNHRLCRAAAHTVKLGAARFRAGFPLIPLETVFFGRIPDPSPSAAWGLAQTGPQQAANAYWLFRGLGCPRGS